MQTMDTTTKRNKVTREVDGARNMEKITGNQTILTDLLTKQILYARTNNYIHWLFHFALISVLCVLMYQFMQFDTYIYEQDGAGGNYIQENNTGGLNNYGTETKKESSQE